MLDLIETIYRKIRTITIGSIMIYNDNLKLYWRITANYIKEAQFANDGGIEVSRIKKKRIKDKI